MKGKRHYIKLTILLIVFNTLIFFFLFFGFRRANTNLIKTEENILIDIQKNEFENYFNRVRSDLMLLTNLVELSGIDYDNKKLMSSIEHSLYNYSTHKKVYDQIRIIDTLGFERVRINYINDHAEIVPASQLQDKSKRYYFNEAKKLNKGDIYYSPFDLNIENNKIVIPYKIITRLATPLVDRNNKTIGYLFINYSGNTLFKTLVELSSTGISDFYLVNQNGFLLHAPDPKEEWSFLFPDKKQYRFQDKWPKIWERILQSPNGQFRIVNIIISYTTLYPIHANSQLNVPNDLLNWKLITITSNRKLFAKNKYVLFEMILMYLFISSFLVLLTKYFSRLQNQKEQLNSAKNELSIINSSLEDIITQRTSELKNEVIQKQLIATDLLNQKTILQSILETSPDLIFLKDSGLRYIAMNSAFANVVGKTEEQIIGKTDNELLTEEVAKNIQNIDQQIQTSGKPRRLEQELTLPDGSIKIYDFIVVPFDDNSGDNLGILGLARDVTELTEQNQTMKKFKAAIDKSFSNVIITDSHARIEFVNNGFMNSTGYTQEEVIGKTPGIINSKYHDRAFYKNMWTTISSGKEWNGEFRNISKDGTYFWELASIIPIENSQGQITHFVKVSQDVTPLKKTEEDLQKAKEVAEAANNAKSMFLANMSHEIRTPLNSIIGFSRLIYQLSESNNVLKNYAEAIQSSGKTLLSIINDVLDLAKIEAGKIEVRLGEMNLKSFIDEVSLNYGILLSNKADLKFSTSIESEIPIMIFTDEFRLKQIINNLMSNAMKFTDKGFIILAVWHEMVGEKLFDLHFEVRDSGIGIPESDKERIFRSFEQSQFQSLKKYGGSGLGMTISQQLATLLNGFISFTSEEHFGSNFKLTLKNLSFISEDNAMQKNTIITKKHKIHFSPSRILVADDVEYNSLLIYESLKEYPFDFYLAKDGQEAFDVVTTFRPDVILMDIRMPEVDGIESSRRIRLLEGFETVPIICITASAIRIDELELTNYFNEVIYKPIDQQQLERVLSHYIKHEKFDEVVESDNKEEDLSMFVDKIEDKQNLKNIFENEILKKWEEAINSPFMEPSVVFGNLVKSIGEEFKVPFFETYGQQVVDHAESYNLPELKKELHNFESVVTFIHKQI